VVQLTVTEDGEKASGRGTKPSPGVDPNFNRCSRHLIGGFDSCDLRQLVADLLDVTASEYTTRQKTSDMRHLRLKCMIFRPPRTNRFFVSPYGWKVARLFLLLEARVFRPGSAWFTRNDAVTRSSARSRRQPA